MFTETISALMQKLMKPSFLGIKLWILIALVLSLLTFLTITVLFFYFTLCRSRKKRHKSHFHWPNSDQNVQQTSSLDKRLLTLNASESLMKSGQIMFARTSACHNRNDAESSLTRSSSVIKDVWRKEFSLLEIKAATNELAKENVIGNGDHGTVYHGVLYDGTVVAVKKLLINSSQAEEFVEKVEELGHVRHKNLVNLLGYCMEGTHRMIVYEYVENKSLHYWLHQCPEQLSPLTWSVRMNIIHGIARGLAYLHEGVERGILHGGLKSSNILVDHQWNPKVSDFGVAQLFDPRWAFILMEALGYMAPENYVSSPEAFTEKDDVYSFGILLMEIITGRSPINRRQSQPYLVEWLKCMVACDSISNVVDPSLPEMPCLKELKRMVLVALRCVDSDEEHRPHIGDITHMLEPRDLLLGEDELQYLSTK